MDLEKSYAAIEEVAAKIDSYRNSLVDTEYFEHSKNDLLTESLDKLKKLSYILLQAHKVNAHIMKMKDAILHSILTKQDSSKTDVLLSDALTALAMYSESFYYTAFRISGVFKELGFKFKSIGVRDVRNHLLEHPQVLSTSFSTDNAKSGPILKNTRRIEVAYKGKLETEVLKDKGLFINFEEFIISINKKMDAIINVST